MCRKKFTFRLSVKNVRNGHSVCQVVESRICVTVPPPQFFQLRNWKGLLSETFHSVFRIYKQRATKEIETWAGSKNKFGDKQERKCDSRTNIMSSPFMSELCSAINNTPAQWSATHDRLLQASCLTQVRSAIFTTAICFMSSKHHANS